MGADDFGDQVRRRGVRRSQRRWRNYQGANEDMSLRWDDTTAGDGSRWTLHDTWLNGMVLENDADADDDNEYDVLHWPDGTVGDRNVHIYRNDDLPQEWQW